MAGAAMAHCRSVVSARLCLLRQHHQCLRAERIRQLRQPAAGTAMPCHTHRAVGQQPALRLHGCAPAEACNHISGICLEGCSSTWYTRLVTVVSANHATQLQQQGFHQTPVPGRTCCRPVGQQLPHCKAPIPLHLRGGECPTLMRCRWTNGCKG